MKDKEEVGKIISNARIKKNITQAALAKKLNVTDKAISNWETGKNLPDREIVYELEKILDIKIEEEIEKPRYLKINKLLIISLFVIAILFIFSLIYFISNYQKINIYQITLNSDNFTTKNSYLTISNNKILFNLDDITYKKNIYNPNLKLTLYHKDTKIVTKYDSSLTLIETKKNYIFFSEEMLKNLNDFHLVIEYNDLDNELITEDIKINFKLIDSNNKMYYSNKKNKSVKINTNFLNLLKNNNYKRVEEYLYEKESNNIIYTYDVIDNILYIKYCNDYCVSASYFSIVSIEYIVMNNNKIIEYNLDKISNGKAYYNEIKNILSTEIDKISIKQNS